MPRSKAEFDQLFPCEFYAPADVLDPELMYTVPEIARLLQGLEPDDQLEPEDEAVLVDWAIPWIMQNSDELVIADPTDETEPGRYGLRREEDVEPAE